jgi:hypothetical protein
MRSSITSATHADFIWPLFPHNPNSIISSGTTKLTYRPKFREPLNYPKVGSEQIPYFFFSAISLMRSASFSSTLPGRKPVASVALYGKRLCLFFSRFHQRRGDKPCRNRDDAQPCGEHDEGKDFPTRRDRINVAVANRRERCNGPPKAVEHGAKFIWLRFMLEVVDAHSSHVEDSQSHTREQNNLFPGDGEGSSEPV